MTKKITTYLFLLSSISLIAKTEIRGRIIEKDTQEPLEFAEIILQEKKSSELIGVMTDENGRFSISAQPGNYSLKVSYVGQILYSQDLSVTETPLMLGNIVIENSNELDEIIVVARKKLIERKVDRLVFNVGNSSKASQGDALAVLGVTPGVRVQNDEISMIGKGNMQVMVNNRIVKLSGLDLVNYLRAIPSENIQRVEVITTPPAKYEASGNSGLLNIILKKARKDAWSAQVKSTYQQQRYPTGIITGTFNYHKDKLSLGTRIFYLNKLAYLENELTTFFPDGRWQTSSPIKIDISGLAASLDLGYQISKNWEMGGQYYYNGSRVEMKDKSTTRVFVYDHNEVSRSLQTEGVLPQFPKVHTINYYNKISLDSLGRELTLNLDYFTYKNSDEKNYEGVAINQDPYSKQFYRSRNINDQKVENLSAKLDMEYPLDWIDLDFGGKLSHSTSINDISFFNSGLVDEPVTEIPVTRNDFEYQEELQSLYFSANKKISDQWTAQFGIRMENTLADAQSQSLDLADENAYTNFFPTFYLSYDATENSNFSLNYSKRIERPTYYDLNPNIYFVDPFQSVEGNPYLEPAFIDNIELTNTYENFVTKLYYTYEDNLFSQVPLPNSTSNVIRTTVRNFINTSRIGISENYTFDKIDWWSSNNSLDINYSESEFNLDREQEDQTGFNATISTSNDFSLNPDKTFLAGLNYWYEFPGTDGIFETRARSALSLSLQALMLDKNLNITLRGNDVFKTAVARRSTNVNGVLQKIGNYYATRSLVLSVSYKFGNKNIQAKENKTGNEDEKNRI
ncbi:TonB-dependent receptor domain-containing protein [Salegentibacter chungangensis]|uniref:TonB-dependent receptor domain-containing protein n=1 Tax=Salegentibacter chungangensis TaxID=1335724 RepID=A0ABW3NR62_9FLAO